MEMMIYFNESEIISNLIQEKGQQAHLTPSLEIVRSTFYSSSCSVNVYQLDANAIYFWAQMPFFQRAKTSLKSSEIPLPDLIFRLRQKQFSGFIDVQLLKKEEGGILFFNEGDRIGGSFSWSTGGMSTSDEDYNTLLSRIQINDGLFSFGSFVRER
ncbi:hypothetical protein [Desulfobulbus oligotrophicus]|uniref:DUF4388 domain-containing protein n=1 Tax=Desulfobulbus oligotrophicus TaxID=1909699 RepID=A0A7T5VE69_9BACT|nr:hypothetical protein [Desulfobulbus oligotrophicus]QQG66269.1 hypothetical protein HP555_10550 [Desulfobulbus oligotrophicus]